MNTNVTKMKICDLEVEIEKKDIKNIHLGVYPPEGRIRVAAPLNSNNDSIRLFLISKIPWIKKQYKKFQDQMRQTKREYVSGETHYLFGKQYRLNVCYTKKTSKIEIKKNTHIDMYIKPDYSTKKREYLLNEFYRSELKKTLIPLVEKWKKITGVNVNQVLIKKMKTKWGSSTPKASRIWLNLELAKKTIHCIEYVLVHELVHFIEKNHTKKFYLLLSSFLPNWEHNKSELNSTVIGYFEWNKTLKS